MRFLFWSYDCKFDVWNGINALGDTARVLLSPLAFDTYAKLLNESKVEYRVVVEDFESLVTEQRKSIARKKSFNDETIVGKYARYEQVNR
jgi:hypothetical protein